MQIRAKLTLQFIIVVSLIIVFCFGVIYYSSSEYRRTEFYERLEKKAITSAEIFISTSKIDSTLLRLFDSRQKDKLAFENISIYNPDNRIIYTNNDSIVFQAPNDLLENTRANGRSEFTRDNFEILGISYIEGGKTYVIFSGAIDKYGLSKLNNLRMTMILLFTLIITVVAATGWAYAGRTLRPLSLVVNEVEKINVERLDARLHSSKNQDEIGRLINTFNILLDRVENSVKLQKLFVSGASHELKNPLTSITSQLQVVLLNERTVEEYKEIIESILEDMRRLNRTTLDLIEYARLNYEKDVQFSPLRIDDVLWHSRDYHVDKNPDCKVYLSLENMPEDERKLIINGNNALLTVACLNLIDNACKFSADKTCWISLSVRDSKILISFSDNGIGLSSEEISLIFEPFYRTNNTAEIKGHGIGLALTKKIIDLHKANIEVISRKDNGSVFTLTFSQKV